MGQAGPADPAAAEHSVAVVEHRGLARRHRTRRRVENELGLPDLRAEMEARRHRRLRRAKLCRDRHACDRRRIGVGDRKVWLGKARALNKQARGRILAEYLVGQVGCLGRRGRFLLPTRISRPSKRKLAL